MSRNLIRKTALALTSCSCFLLVAGPNLAENVVEPSDADVEFFEQQVEPILENNCRKCHGADEAKGGLRLTSRAAVLKGGDLGPSVSLEDPDNSELLGAINYEGLEMPPSGKLAAEQIEILTKWVKLGLPWTPGAGEEEEADEEHATIDDEARDYWAYRPVERPNIPHVADITWPRNPIDNFVLSKLEHSTLSPAKTAAKTSLVRRVYYDLTGLPPTPQEVGDYLRDTAPDAYERLVDRLLASPRYGEKWGRHWLDLVRYAETNGYERDGPKANVWRFRDYVIDAFNADKPYDRLILEQLAGDELTDGGPEGLVATGYYRLGIWDDEPADPVQAYYDSLDDVVATTGAVFMGTTIGCARCHDHKIDPIPQRDYYRLMAFFNNIYKNIREDVYEKRAFTLNTLAEIATPAEREEHQRRNELHRTRLEETRQHIEALEQKISDTFSEPEKEDAKDKNVRGHMLSQKASAVLDAASLDRYHELNKELADLTKTKIPPLPQALVVRENGPEPPDAFVLVRGNAHSKGDPVQPGYPVVLDMPDPVISPSTIEQSCGRRLVVAEWLTDPRHPLVARVMVNRLWQHHFGRGLVRSTSDFGRAGQPPTHPQLLDWLASEFIRQDWQLKAMHRLMMTSSTYRMAYVESPEAMRNDPTNNLLWRFDMRRLTAEELRDTILAVTGRLNGEMGGPSIYTEIPREILQSASRPDAAWGNSPPGQRDRRSVYVHVKRSLAEPVLATFDVADTDASCPVRFATTVATQALTTLNGQFLNNQASVFADRLRREAGEQPKDQVIWGLRLALCRAPTDLEVARSVKLLRDWQEQDGVTTERALDYFCLMVLNLNELVYLD